MSCNGSSSPGNSSSEIQSEGIWELGGVILGVGQTLIDELPGNFEAASATRGRAARLLQLGDILNAVVYGIMNLLVGDSFAKTDVHGYDDALRCERRYLNANHS